MGTYAMPRDVIPLTTTAVGEAALAELRRIESELLAAEELLRETTEAALRRTERALSAFWTTSLDLMAEVEAPETLRRVNPAWQRTLGYDADFLRGEPISDLAHPLDRTAAIAAFAGDTVSDFSCRLLSMAGEMVVVCWSLTRADAEGTRFATGRICAGSGATYLLNGKLAGCSACIVTCPREQ